MSAVERPMDLCGWQFGAHRDAIKELAGVMREHGVAHYKAHGIEIVLGPAPIDPPQAPDKREQADREREAQHAATGVVPIDLRSKLELG